MSFQYAWGEQGYFLAWREREGGALKIYLFIWGDLILNPKKCPVSLLGNGPLKD